MASLADMSSAVQDYFRTMMGGQASGNFFESRHTRTPGQFVNLPAGQGGHYDPDIVPNQQVGTSDLDLALKQALMKEWSNKQGFMKVAGATDDKNKSRIIKHESMHDIYDKAGLEGSVDKIVPTIDPLTVQWIKDQSLYQNKLTPGVLANEGMAYNVSEGKSTQELRDLLAKLLAGKPQKSQVEGLLR